MRLLDRMRGSEMGPEMAYRALHSALTYLITLLALAAPSRQIPVSAQVPTGGMLRSLAKRCEGHIIGVRLRCTSANLLNVLDDLDQKLKFPLRLADASFLCLEIL